MRDRISLNYIPHQLIHFNCSTDYTTAKINSYSLVRLPTNLHNQRRRAVRPAGHRQRRISTTAA